MSDVPVAVAASDVSGTYGEELALGPSSFAVPTASITAVIGPNGSGKSTLLNLIAGLIDPISGSLSVLDTSAESARPRVAYVLQSTSVSPHLPISVTEVVAMARFRVGLGWNRTSRADRAAVAEALDRLSIRHLAHRSLHELSGGERQRVLVAQGLAQEHSVLLLDEPLVGVDLVSSGAIEAAMGEERALGRTVVFTTHDLGQAMSSDFVLLLAGSVLAAGPPAEVLTPENLGRAYGLAGDLDRVTFDDPAHQGRDRFHVHFERSIHLEAPGANWHGSDRDN